MQILLYALFTTILFLLIKVFSKKEPTKVLIKEAAIVFISSIVGSFIAGKVGVTEIKNIVKTAPVFTDSAGF